MAYSGTEMGLSHHVRFAPWSLGLVGVLALCTLGCPEQEAAEAREASGEEPAGEPAAQAGGGGAKPEAEGSESDRGDEGEAAGEPAPVSVKESLFTNNLPSEEPLGVVARMEAADEVAVILERLDAQCGPVPEFEARRMGETLALRRQSDDPEPDCIGTHDMKLRIMVPAGEAPERVRVLDVDGTELGEAEVEPEG